MPLKKSLLHSLLILFGVMLLSLTLVNPALCSASDTLVYATQSKVGTLDYYKTSSGIAIIAGNLLWDTVVERDPKTNKIVPGAAKSWKAINDTTWEFKLYPNIKFHNGNPLTAEAVKFTIMEGILNPDRKSNKAGRFKFIDKIEVIDDLTFRIITKDPYPLILEYLTLIYIYDPIHIKANGFESIDDNPMGSGAYKLTKWVRGSELVFERNQDYWKKDSAKIKNIKIRVIPEASTRLAELLSGGVDLATSFPADMIDSLEKSKTVEPLIAPTAEVNFWQFDSVDRASKTPVADKRVRQAIWHAIDRKAIVKNVLKGTGSVLNAPTNPLMFGHDPDIKGYEYNPEKAKALLKEAGYENGFEIDLWQYVNHQKYTNQAAIGFLNNVGIKVNLKDYIGNIGQMVKLRNAGKITGIGNFEWITTTLDADIILYPWFAPNPKNYSQDEELEKLIKSARSTLDKAKRIELYKKVQKKIIDEVYWMPFYTTKMLAGKKKNLHIDMVAGQFPWIKGAYWK
jgi:peptide/nickel transport system substrate-binding protein